MVAPLALLAVGFALFTVVGSTLGDEDPNSEAAVQQSSGNAQGGNGDGGNGNKGKRKTPKRYEVKGGDTITAIAEKFGVDVDRIQRLNPDVDSQALTPGQKLKLRN